ncbi:MAG: TauD/TfdA dioxygenase family protein [Alphaproteobacteria bacterium]
MQIRPLGECIGVEVAGIDLRNLDDDSFRAIRQAWLDRCVLVVRDQTLAPPDHIAFSRMFGTLFVHKLNQYNHPDFPEVFLVSNKQVDGRYVGIRDAGRHWHSDTSYMDFPSKGSLLHALELPPEGGQTMFANMYRAWETLPEDLKARVEGRRAVFRYPGFRTEPQKATFPDAMHPIVRTHPETGRKALYVNEGHTIGIEGMDEAQAKPLLDALYRHSTQPEFVYVHEWRLGDLVFWDNRCAMHHALPYDEARYVRHMHRTTLDGDRPF